MKRLLVFACWGVGLLVGAAEPEVRVLVIRGADGTEAYGRDFAEQSRLWKEAAGRAGAGFEEVGPEMGEGCLAKAKMKLEEWV